MEQKLKSICKDDTTSTIAKDVNVVVDTNLSASDLEKASDPVPKETLHKIIDALLKRLTTKSTDATPIAREARQFLTFFVTSLFNPQFPTPPSLTKMMSWTTLVPVYQEDIIYAIQVLICYF